MASSPEGVLPQALYFTRGSCDRGSVEADLAFWEVRSKAMPHLAFRPELTDRALIDGPEYICGLTQSASSERVHDARELRQQGPIPRPLYPVPREPLIAVRNIEATHLPEQPASPAMWP